MNVYYLRSSISSDHLVIDELFLMQYAPEHPYAHMDYFAPQEVAVGSGEYQFT